MTIIPAIDIKNGRCVRLTQGNFSNEKVYSDNPVAIARQWEEQGAQLLHIVDLDGAKDGNPVNLEVIKKIVQAIKIPIQVGGGIRNKETVKKLLSISVARVILGTLALEDGNELKSILKDYAPHVAIALDTKNGKLMKQGWLENSERNSVVTARKLEKLGVQRFIYTDVVRDGTLTEPNYKEITRLTKSVSVSVIASGGISSINSIKKLKSIGLEGVIIGKALYKRRLSLREVLNMK